ncbi:MAG TPA: glutathione synthase [Polyangiaceae bacterium]|nr:glutathione synthase [Polyangiaceae bacterium]
MRFVFVMDPMDRVAVDKDTTFAMQRAAQRRGHVCHHCELRDVYVHDGDVWANVRPLRLSDAEPYFSLGAGHDLRLSEADCVFVRKDPPFDSEYLHATLMLERLRGKALVLNDPRGLREANEKLYAIHFVKYMPRTLVTTSRERIHRFISEMGTAVVKPLDGAGGNGVLVVSNEDRNTRSIVDTITREGTRHAMVQEYLSAVREGDKRVLVLDGEVLGAINRIARDDDVRSNIHAGGRVEPCEVTAAERQVVAEMAGRLTADGLVFVGLDFIGGKLTEVNVTSPTGIQELSRHVGRDVAERIIAWVERHSGDYRTPRDALPSM